ncbi:hypothetical protein AWV79_21140 [Cupriavidus sp. UYMMa02A]|nr:hypothetical protein AWV79_21140 [Cupriavidus sp. UYMMa02A]
MTSTLPSGRMKKGSTMAGLNASVQVPRTAPLASMVPSQLPETRVPSSDSSIRKLPSSHSPASSRTPATPLAVYSPRRLSRSSGLGPMRSRTGLSPTLRRRRAVSRNPGAARAAWRSCRRQAPRYGAPRLRG